MKALTGLPLLVMLTGCVEPWPANMTPVTYSGVVVDASSHRPAAHVPVTAYRPAEKHAYFLFGDRICAELANGETDDDGRFVLRTPGGYATYLDALPRHPRSRGTLQAPHGDARNLVILLQPIPEP